MRISSDIPFAEARWIASSLVGGAHTTAPAPYFRKEFSIPQPLRSAELAVTALGLYEVEINGAVVGDQVLAPGWTEYAKRVPYQVFDVLPLLRQGGNAIGAIVGDGWYCGHVAWEPRQHYGDRPKLRARLRLVFRDGTEASLVTDLSWKTVAGPILESDLLMGESYDARLELGTWSLPGYDDAAWHGVLLPESPEIEFTRSEAPPVRRVREFSPLSERRLPIRLGEMRLFDLGQNFSGRVRIRVRARRGTTVALRFAEILQQDETLYTDNLRQARATDHYTCRGEGVEDWEPRFTFHGFRHVAATGLAPDDAFELVGVALQSDTRETGRFACSDALLNQLQHNIVWGQRSNFLEVPTDCPQRDERLGWTGDAQVFIRTAAFNMDVRGFFRKWMQDLRDAQTPEGAIPMFAPRLDYPGRDDGGPGWSDATIICPWTIYLCYGDRLILEEHYESMERYLDFTARKRCLGHIRCHPDLKLWQGYGDWLALDGGGKADGITPKDLIGTAFYAHGAALLSRIADLLGKPQDAERYRRLHGEIVRAFQDRFVTPDGLLLAGTQTAYILALHFDLLPEEQRAQAAQVLADDIEGRGFHLATGFLGTPYLLDVLEENGRLDIAYRLLQQETFPSWLFPVKNGATTIWERWDGWTPEKGPQDKGMNSYNHYAYGAVGAWMYRTVAGLDLDPREPGYQHIVFRPRPGGTLTWAEAELDTPQGRTRIRWETVREGLFLDLLVPDGSRATLRPPEGFGKAIPLQAGRHRMTLLPEEHVLAGEALLAEPADAG